MKFWKTKNKQNESPAGEKAVTKSREYIAESLESRILFSGAPIDAPDASVSEESVTPDATGGNSFSTIKDFGSGAIQSDDAQGVSDEIILASFNNLTPSEIEDLANEVNNAGLDEHQADLLLNLEASRINVTVPEGASGYETEVDSDQLSGQSHNFGTTISFPLLPSEQLGIDLITDAPLEISDSATLERLAGESAAQSTVDVPLANLPITTDILSVIADAAGQHWINSGLTAEQIDALNEIEYHIVELEGAALGYAEGSNVYIDDDAAGMEWFIDETPQELGESGFTGIDLLSVLAHEQGHVLGLEDIYDTARSSDLLYGIFEEGERRFVADNQAQGAIAGSLEGKHYATLSISDETVVEGDTITFTATLDEEVPGGFTVDVDFADDTATGGNIDYAGTETLLTDNFSTGAVQTSSRITTANADSGSWHAFSSASLWEIDTSGGTLSNPGTGEGTSNTDERVNEGLVAQVLTVDSLDPNLNLITVSFDYEIGAGSTVYFHSHLLKEDGTPTNNQLFNTGVANGNIQSQWKNNGYLSANLSGNNGAQNGSAGTAVASFTNSTSSSITDSYSMTFDISDYIAENASTGGSLEIDSISDVDVLMFGFANNIVNRDGTGAVSISNFNISASPTASTTLTFAGTAGENQTFTVTTNDDSILETTESFNVSLSNLSPSGAGVDITDEASGTITDNDNTAPVITQGDSPLSVTMSEDGSPTSFVAPTIDATDANAGDTLTWSLLSGGEASNGTATVSGTGATPTITYTPTGNFNGNDSFTVQVTDAYGATDNIVVNVTVEQVNDTGTFTGDVSGSGTEDSDLTGTLTFADAIDGATTPGYFITSDPGNGSASIDSNGAWTYTPAEDFNGTDSFTVSATDDDGNLESQVVSVTVNQVNDPGTFAGDTSGTGTEDNPVSGTLTFTDSADGSATPGYTVSADPAKGVAAIDSNGAWTYTPNGGFIGTDTFTVSATDGAGNIETQLVTVTIEATPVVTETGESDNISLVYKFLETHRLFGENGTLTVEIRANGPNGALIDRFDLSGNYGQQVVEYELARNVVPNNGYGFVIFWEAGSEDRNREDSYEQLALTLDGSTVVTLLDILSNDIYTAMISQLSKDNATV
ncbi:MAG: tandem-95 repeat protein [Verrucomicrobiales bacterium]|nr:tandem-95 repeat protein [Verrucomicrobiales bacterium]